MKGYISDELYGKILDCMPICCVDLVVVFEEKLYLFKRSYNPGKDQWWVVGGRVFKGEKLEDAVKRKAKEEIGVEVKIIRQIGVFESFFEINRNGSNGTHSVAVVYLVEAENNHFKINDEYTGYQAFSSIPENLNPYIEQLLKEAKIFSKK